MIRKRSVFTMLEMVAVIAILGVALSIGVIALRDDSPGAVLDSEAQGIRKLCAEARRTATAAGTTVHIRYDPTVRTLSFLKNQLVLTGELLQGDHPFTEKTTIFNFFPDGSASEQDIVLTVKELSYHIKISPLTGAITVVEDK